MREGSGGGLSFDCLFILCFKKIKDTTYSRTPVESYRISIQMYLPTRTTIAYRLLIGKRASMIVSGTEQEHSMVVRCLV